VLVEKRARVGQVDGNEFSIPVESNERSVAIEQVHGCDDGVSKLAGGRDALCAPEDAPRF